MAVKRNGQGRQRAAPRALRTARRRPAGRGRAARHRGANDTAARG